MNAIMKLKHLYPAHVNMPNHATIYEPQQPWRRLRLHGTWYIGKESDFTHLSQHGSHTPLEEGELLCPKTNPQSRFRCFPQTAIFKPSLFLKAETEPTMTSQRS